MSEARIIFLNRVYWPSTAATAQLLTDLAEGLAARGWPVHVITTGESSSRHNGVTVHRTGPGEQHGGMLSRALNYRRFQAAARRQLSSVARPGDIVVPMTDPPMLGAATARQALAQGARVVHWIQDIYPEIAAVHFGLLAGFFLAPLKASRNSAWRSAQNCVTLGDDMRQSVVNQGVTPEHITLIPNWAPRELQAPATRAAVETCRSRWGLGGKFVVAYSGNLGRVHEFATVLQAAALLRDNSSVVFLFIGAGARFDEISAIARARGLDNIRMLPPESRENLAVSLAAADVQLVTLLPEFSTLVYPSKLAGVLAAGRPVLFVGPPGGDIARLLQQDDCGATLNPGDPAGLAGTLARWQSDAGLMARLGSNARAAYERQFTFEQALTQWEDVLRRCGGVQ
jgi:glycosyltransferase involved in cell wall biosynthesis